MKNNPQYPAKMLACWHPVAYAHEVGADRPYGAILLDEPVVLWRDADGQALAMKDVCIHRGTALSLGWLADGCLVCPYHGWRYDEDGKCVLIPQRTDPNIPEKARLEHFHCRERYGLLWVALREPVYALPEIPELEDGTWKVVNTGPFA